MKKLLLATTFLAAFPVTGVSAKVCDFVTGIGTGAANVGFYDGNCSSDNQANDGDDVKAFLDKGAAASGVTTLDMSLQKNTAALADQNTEFIDDSPLTSFGGFTDGNGFANIKADLDSIQKFTIDPLVPSSENGAPFKGFDGMLFRLQLADAIGAILPKKDTGSITLTVNFSDGTSATDTFSGITLNNDTGVYGFDEPAGVAGLFVKSVDISTDSLHALDQVKQIEFSVPGLVATIPEPSTWVMMVAGFALIGGFGFARRRNRLSAPF